jgi:hypothetical protein
MLVEAPQATTVIVARSLMRVWSSYMAAHDSNERH